MCDTFCHLGDGHTVFAKNSDRPRGEPQVVERHVARPPGGRLATQYLELDDTGALGCVGSRPTWLWGFEHGVNAAGVAIGNERVYTREDPALAAPSLIGMDLVRLGLERATTATEAITVLGDLLDRYGQGGVANQITGEPYFSSFLIADAASAWIMETTGSRWAVEPVETGAAISNRLTMRTGWTRSADQVEPGTDVQEWIDPAMPTGHADVRLAVTRDRALRGGSWWEAATTLRDHGFDPTAGGDGKPGQLPGPVADFDGTGVSVCMHIRGFDATSASMVAVLSASAPPMVRAALGSPCASVFVPVWVDSPAPACLAGQATWRQAVAIRDRLEAITDLDAGAGAAALAAVRQVLDPLERDLDAAATAADSATDRRQVTDFVDGEVPAALARARAAID